MLTSMTGYGRGLWQSGTNQIQVELRSVNGRYLNTRFRMPDGLLRFESLLENQLKQNLGRGSVSCHVQWKKEGHGSSFNTEKLMSIWHELQQLSKANNITSELNLGQLALLPELNENTNEFITPEDLKIIEEGLTHSLNDAIKEINTMRELEGTALKQQLQTFSKELRNLSKQVFELAPQLSANQQTKFIDRLQKMDTNIEISVADLSRELAILADRSDISEETTRLLSHLNQLDDNLEQGGMVGRKLDFVLQELNREINTIGSKSSSAELSKLVVEMKTLAEKIREQVQNIE